MKEGDLFTPKIKFIVDSEFFKTNLFTYFKFFDIKRFFLEKDLTNLNPLIFILLKLNNNDVDSNFIFKFCSLIYQYKNMDLAFFINLYYEPNIYLINDNESEIDIILTWRELFEESITSLEIADYEEYYEEELNKEFLVSNFYKHFDIFKPNETIKFLEDFQNNNEISDVDKNFYNRFFLLNTFQSLLLIYKDSYSNEYIKAWYDIKKTNV